VIEAVQWLGYHEEDGGNLRDVLKFMGKRHDCHIVSAYNLGKSILPIETLDGEIIASQGDWIIKDATGEFYPCKPDIFEATYEKVEE
jgi:hypothetical protein